MKPTPTSGWRGRARISASPSWRTPIPTCPTGPPGFIFSRRQRRPLNAVLVAHGRPAPRTHDLEQLVEAVAAFEPSLAGWADLLLGLDDFGVAQRYPGVDGPSIDLEAASASVRELVAAAERACARRR
ncbi:MAG: HEPN domain-containing protein [Myxococcales bacterium]|nr:HEPN domain-containing protein [Myxococcales bacterium]